MKAFKRFERNKAGRDFVVGDIHGCFSKLDEKLRHLEFNPVHDRLFSVGDLVDRGPKSARALAFLHMPWFHPVRGNHEQMAIDYAKGSLDAATYAYNGGGWFIALPHRDQAPFVDVFSAMPFAIEVETDDGLVGIVHADCPVPVWSELDLALEGPHHAAVETACLWSRDRITNAIEEPIGGVLAVFVGHTPVQHVTRLANVIYIDTGAVFGRDLTMVQLQDT